MRPRKTNRHLPACVYLKHGAYYLVQRKGAPFTYSTVRTLWDRACTAASIEDAHMHDIRAKAATDAKKQGIDSKSLLGHHSESSHLRYLRSKETPIVTPVANMKKGAI